MKTLIRHLASALPFVVIFTLFFLLPSCDGGPGLFQPGTTWVAIEPTQCFSNAWEQDWLARHGNNPSEYPTDSLSQYAIISEYYGRQGVLVTGVISIPTYEVVCLACSCPRGDVLYLQVRDRDVGKMADLGFRVELPHWPTPPDTTLTGVYDYSGYDSTYTKIISGTLTITQIDSTTVSGRWALSGPAGYGPQVGTGTFEGWRNGRNMVINLNPGWADNNVFLNGDLRYGVYAGIWEWDTFVGPTASGRFTAIKNGQR